MPSKKPEKLSDNLEPRSQKSVGQSREDIRREIASIFQVPLRMVPDEAVRIVEQFTASETDRILNGTGVEQPKGLLGKKPTANLAAAITNADRTKAEAYFDHCTCCPTCAAWDFGSAPQPCDAGRKLYEAWHAPCREIRCINRVTQSCPAHLRTSAK